MRVFPNSLMLVHFLRIFGHFPYRKESQVITNEVEDSDSNNDDRRTIKENCVFTPSKAWKIWSIAFCLLTTSLTFYNACELNYLSKSRTFGVKSLRIPYLINDSLLYIGLFLMNFFSMKNSHTLCELLNTLYAFMATTKIDKKKHWKTDFNSIAPYLVLITAICFMVLFGKVQLVLFRSAFHMYFYLFVTTVSILLVSIYSSLFHGILGTVGTLFEAAFSDLTNYSRNVEEKYCNATLKKFHKRSTSSVGFSNIFKTATKCCSKTESLSETEMFDKQIQATKITASDIRRCKITVLQLYSFKRLIIFYFDILIIVFMVELISSLIIALFYISILNRNFEEILIPICRSSSCIISLLCLLNAPYKVNKQVWL